MCWLVVACSSTGPAAPSAQQLHNSAALVRATLCNGIATGSGFFISDREVVTMFCV